MSHEALRTGFWAGAAGCGWSCLSFSSSELASASESGVDRLPANLSSKRDGLLEVMEEGFDGTAFAPPAALALEGFELILPDLA